jgi:hypothetical protein
MTTEAIKKVKIYITSIAGILASIYGVYEGYSAISHNIDEIVKDKVQHYSKPLINKRIKFTVDSMVSKRSNKIRIGLFIDMNDGRLKYKHTNQHVYRPFLDEQQDDYYFINDDNLSEWCK